MLQRVEVVDACRTLPQELQKVGLGLSSEVKAAGCAETHSFHFLGQGKKPNLELVPEKARTREGYGRLGG